MEAFQILLNPFIGCVILILIHAYFGIHILERGVIFLDLSLAQFIAVGIACSFYVAGDDANRLPYAVAFAVLGASIFAFSKKIGRWVNIEAFIGVLYVFSFAASLLILDRSPHGAEEFKSILNGNILWMTSRDLEGAGLLYTIIGAFHFVYRRKFPASTYRGNNSLFWEFAFFLSFALVLVSSVQIAGVLQVFAFLIIPALIGKVYSKVFRKVLLVGWAIGLGVTPMGLFLSYTLDLPTAPVLIACLSLLFFILLGIRAKRGNSLDHKSKNGA